MKNIVKRAKKVAENRERKLGIIPIEEVIKEKERKLANALIDLFEVVEDETNKRVKIISLKRDFSNNEGREGKIKVSIASSDKYEYEEFGEKFIKKVHAIESFEFQSETLGRVCQILQKSGYYSWGPEISGGYYVEINN